MGESTTFGSMKKGHMYQFLNLGSILPLPGQTPKLSITSGEGKITLGISNVIENHIPYYRSLASKLIVRYLMMLPKLINTFPFAKWLVDAPPAVTVTAKSSGGSKINLLKNAAPDIFINGYSRVCQKNEQPIPISPDKVASYRLIGYENRSLNNEDFVNDSTDAGEIGAGQTITALYEVALTTNLSAGPYAQFDFRYKKPGESASRLLQHSINSSPKQMAQASENMRFAASLTAFGLIMKQSAHKGTADKQMVLNLGATAKTFDPNGYRSQFIDIVNKWIPD